MSAVEEGLVILVKLPTLSCSARSLLQAPALSPSSSFVLDLLATPSRKRKAFSPSHHSRHHIILAEIACIGINLATPIPESGNRVNSANPCRSETCRF